MYDENPKIDVLLSEYSKVVTIPYQANKILGELQELCKDDTALTQRIAIEIGAIQYANDMRNMKYRQQHNGQQAIIDALNYHNRLMYNALSEMQKLTSAEACKAKAMHVLLDVQEPVKSADHTVTIKRDSRSHLISVALIISVSIFLCLLIGLR